MKRGSFAGAHHVSILYIPDFKGQTFPAAPLVRTVFFVDWRNSFSKLKFGYRWLYQGLCPRFHPLKVMAALVPLGPVVTHPWLSLCRIDKRPLSRYVFNRRWWIDFWWLIQDMVQACWRFLCRKKGVSYLHLTWWARCSFSGLHPFRFINYLNVLFYVWKKFFSPLTFEALAIIFRIFLWGANGCSKISQRIKIRPLFGAARWKSAWWWGPHGRSQL